MKITRGLILCFAFAAVFSLIPGCCFDIEDIEIGSDGGTYGCSYDTRHSGCGGKDWSSWEHECFEFNMDNYRDDWTPQRVCNQFSGSDTSCSATCCIYTQYQNTQLTYGGCY